MVNTNFKVDSLRVFSLGHWAIGLTSNSFCRLVFTVTKYAEHDELTRLFSRPECSSATIFNIPTLANIVFSVCRFTETNETIHDDFCNLLLKYGSHRESAITIQRSGTVFYD